MAKTALVISMTSAMFNCSVIGNDLERWEMMKVPTTMYDNGNGMDCIVRVINYVTGNANGAETNEVRMTRVLIAYSFQWCGNK